MHYLTEWATVSHRDTVPPSHIFVYNNNNNNLYSQQVQNTRKKKIERKRLGNQTTIDTNIYTTQTCITVVSALQKTIQEHSFRNSSYTS